MRTRVTLLVIGGVAVAGLLARWFVPSEPSPWYVRLAEITLGCASLALAVHLPLPGGGGQTADAAAGPAWRVRVGAAWLLAPFVCLALLGLLLSLVAHLCGLLGLTQPLGESTGWLHVGVFVVMPAAMLAGGRWDSPAWMRRVTSGLVVYTCVNFCTFFVVFLLTEFGEEYHPSPLTFRGVSGHWMLFYWIAAALMCSAATGGTSEPAPGCPAPPPASAPPRRPPVGVPDTTGGVSGKQRPADS